MPQHISVHSFDIDGCIFNMDYILDGDNPNRLIDHNEKLFEQLKEELAAKKVNEALVFVGSNRQSYRIDCLNTINYFMQSKPSCFPIMQQLATEIARRTGLPCKVDPYLLSDTYANKPAGYSFNKAIEARVSFSSNSEFEPHPEWVVDESKFSMLYVQMHKTASENPDAIITFNFYDDKLSGILMDLSECFKKHPELVPANVELNLWYYAGGKKRAALHANIKGEAKNGIDFKYAETLKMFLEIQGIKEYEYFDRAYRYVYGLNFDEVKQRRSVIVKENVEAEVKLVIEDLIERTSQLGLFSTTPSAAAAESNLTTTPSQSM